MKSLLVKTAVSLCLIGSLCFNDANAAGTRVPYPALFDEICRLVKANFYDPSLIQKELPLLKEEYGKKMEMVSGQADFSAQMNAMLGRLNASHTYYLSPSDYEYYHLAAVFAFLPEIKKVFHYRDIKYPTVGIVTERIGGCAFIVSVLPGSVAEHAGLLAGDEIVAVNGKAYQPIESIRDHVGKEVVFAVRRSPGGDVQRFFLKPGRVNPKMEMLEAEKASTRLIEIQGNKVGYIHIYSYAGQEYHDELVSAVSCGVLSNADALIIDLRYGLGGADPAYLNLFNANVPVITSMDNTGKTNRYDPQWRKPAAFLVNRTTRSGKEILAYGAKKYKLATVTGERTAGAVLGARLFPLSNGDLLYLAGMRSRIDGVDLEGVGVAPDIEIPVDIRYCAGKDVQLEKTVEHLVEVLRHGKS